MKGGGDLIMTNTNGKNVTTEAERVRKILIKQPLLTKPLSEAAFFKGIALILAGLDAHAHCMAGKDGEMKPDHFLPMVIAYMLRSEGPVDNVGQIDGDDISRMAKDLGL